MGYKGAWSGIVGIGILTSFWLASIMGATGCVVGIIITIVLLMHSNTIYKETPGQIEKNRTYQEKCGMTYFCKTADEVHDVLFRDKVERAAKGFARKKGLKFPDSSCYCMAIKSYTQNIMYSSQACFPEFLKKNGCTMVYYKPIYRFKEGNSFPYHLGYIFTLAISNRGLHEVDIPNGIDTFSRMKYNWLDSWYKEVETTKISDPRWTIESERRRV